MGRRIKHTLRFLRPLSDRPFATALAGLLLLSAAAVIGHWGLTTDALAGLVPHWLLIALAVAYGIGGIMIIVGILVRKSNFEAAGCVLVSSGLLIRLIAVFYVLGFNFATFTTCLFYVLFGWACLERFRQIIEGDQIIRVHKRVELILTDPNGEIELTTEDRDDNSS